METTDKESCNILVSLLRQSGIRHAVVSPGSRNAPIIVALARCKDIQKTVVIDERSAAFMALGIASIELQPVVLVCTSGSALLNYAPAISEAYYRHIPLIVVSADRPMEWIDQDDSQTIRQFEALSNYVKKSYNIPARCDSPATRWYVNRSINDALISVNSRFSAPVHINIQLDEPLNNLQTLDESKQERFIEIAVPEYRLNQEFVDKIVSAINSSKKVLIIAGFMSPDITLNENLKVLAKRDNIAILCENISNLKNNAFISSIDRTLSIFSDHDKGYMRPDIIITMGGALVSRHIKQYFRNYKPSEHWHIGITDLTVDCFTVLTKRIDTTPSTFFSQLVEIIADTKPIYSTYASDWAKFSNHSENRHNKYLNSVGWCDLKAFDIIHKQIPSGWNVQLSNGTSIRYAQLFNTTGFNRIDCNRGVSGIDGCTSTAVGASIVYDGVTLLISGDMSAQYDIGALASDAITPRFKMIIINNAGGGIFRFIKSTSDLEELEEYFTVPPRLPLPELSAGYGFKFFDAKNESELLAVLPDFINESTQPAMLRINTPAQYSTKILKEYFNCK